MQEKRTIHQILLDASGSMEPSADTAIDTCAALLERFRTEADRQTGTGVLVGLALFEETARTLYSDRHPGEATVPDPAGFPGTGSSALFDASMIPSWLSRRAGGRVGSDCPPAYASTP